MIRIVALVYSAIIVLFAVPTFAQSDQSKTRLDDFAVPEAQGSFRVEQVEPKPDRVDLPRQIPDRIIGGVTPDERRPLRTNQVSSTGGSSAPDQISDESNPTLSIPTAGSTAADSRPRGATRLAGSDRCDPQLPERDLARCLLILELRAQEFSAPAPPQLSAEQSLLAGQQSAGDRSMAHSSQTNLRFATGQDPDADLDSNQELASIYLTDPAVVSTPPAEGELPEDAATLAEIIVAITQGLPPTTN